MSRDVIIDLVYNYPSAGRRGQALIGALAAHIIADSESAMRYLPVEGLPEQRDRVARWLSFPGYEIEPERVGFGVSGHQLLLAILLGLTRPGAAIACDPITYNGWLNITRHAGRRNLPIPGDEQGMLPEALDELAAREAVWGVFLMPSLHNPCTTRMPLARRRAIVDVCRRRDLWIVDDDAYRFLDAEASPSFAHLFPQRTFWLQSLSKPLFASIKTSFVVGPTSAMPVLREGLRVTGHQPSALTLPWVLDLLDSGQLDELLAFKREQAARRQALAVDALAGLCVHRTPGSFHLWVDLPDRWTAESATAALLSAGVAVVSGAAYAVENTAPPRSIRLALAGEVDEDRVAEGLRRVGQVLP